MGSVDMVSVGSRFDGTGSPIGLNLFQPWTMASLQARKEVKTFLVSAVFAVSLAYSLDLVLPPSEMELPILLLAYSHFHSHQSELELPILLLAYSYFHSHHHHHSLEDQKAYSNWDDGKNLRSGHRPSPPRHILAPALSPPPTA